MSVQPFSILLIFEILNFCHDSYARVILTRFSEMDSRFRGNDKKESVFVVIRDIRVPESSVPLVAATPRYGFLCAS
jgi:hypothetical protein